MNTLGTPALLEQARRALLAHDGNAELQADADGGPDVRTTPDQIDAVRLPQAAPPLATRVIAARSDCCGGGCSA